MKSTMSSRIRQLIFSFVVIGFVLGLAWILLYSSGYNFNWTQLAWQATGGIQLSVQPTKDVLVIVLPNGLTSRTSQTTFTHLLPGQYHVKIEVPDHLTTNLTIEVQPNITTVIDPLYLWPDQVLLSSTTQTQSTSTSETTELPIVFQSILAQHNISANTDYYLVSQRQMIVLDPATRIVMEYTRDGSVITSQQLGSDIAQMALAQNKLLLVSEFSLAVVDLSVNTTETITRLSTPILQATWLKNMPYIAYATSRDLHIIDIRKQTNYLDQVVATTPQETTELWFDVEHNNLQLVLGTKTYRWPLELSK